MKSKHIVMYSLVTIMATALIVYVLVDKWFLDDWIHTESWGSSNLGNNIFLLEFESNKKSIVLCEKRSEKGNTCHISSSIIPESTNLNTIIITDVLFDDYWIIVKCVDNDT